MKAIEYLAVLIVVQLLFAPGAARAVSGGSDPTDQFLTGNFLDIGINHYGTLGSLGAAPTGFHTRSSSATEWSTNGSDRLGITYDQGQDGWGVGHDIGDLFMAGTPFEGFALSVDSVSAWNTGNEVWELGPGTFTQSDSNSATWVLDSAFRGIGLTQKFRISPSSNQLFITVKLSNQSNTNVSNVYYTRCVDPDTVEPDFEGMLTTSNAVIGRYNVDGYAAVWAKSPVESLPADLGLWSYEPTAKAHIDCSNPVEDYSGLGTEQLEFIDADTNIGVTVFKDLLLPGEEFEFSYGYGMSPTDIAPPPPVLPSTQKENSLLAATILSLLLLALASLVYRLAEHLLEPDF